jgi:hypothetical protein
LTGHQSPDWLIWCFQHGILPLFTPVSGSWLNMAESNQHIMQRRALAGQYPQAVATIIAWLEAPAQPAGTLTQRPLSGAANAKLVVNVPVNSDFTVWPVLALALLTPSRALKWL